MTSKMTATPATPPTTPPTTWGVLGLTGLSKLSSELEDVPEVPIETGAVAVAVKVAAAPAAPGAVLPGVDCENESDVLVETAAASDGVIELTFAVSEERVLVISVVLEYDTLIVDTGELGLVLSEVAETSSFEEDSSDVEPPEGFRIGLAVGLAAGFGVRLAVGVKVISDGTGEEGGDESTD